MSNNVITLVKKMATTKLQTLATIVIGNRNATLPGDDGLFHFPVTPLPTPNLHGVNVALVSEDAVATVRAIKANKDVKILKCEDKKVWRGANVDICILTTDPTVIADLRIASTKNQPWQLEL